MHRFIFVPEGKSVILFSANFNRFNERKSLKAESLKYSMKLLFKSRSSSNVKSLNTLSVICFILLFDKCNTIILTQPRNKIGGMLFKKLFDKSSVRKFLNLKKMLFGNSSN